VQSKKLGVVLVAIPGGSFDMGLSADEKRELTKLVKGKGPEAAMHVRELAKIARPVATKVAPFLCADAVFEDRYLSEKAAELVEESKLRLLTEPEWEWVARAGGTRSWIPVNDDAHPFAIRDLGCSEWVDTGMSRPEWTRAGGLDLLPAQVGGEFILLHAASRDKASDSAHCAVRLAFDLAAR